jgi:hypothetical protein
VADLAWYEQNLSILAGFTISQVWTFVGPLLAGAVGAILTRWFRKQDDNEARREVWLARELEETYRLICDAREVPGMPEEAAFECKLKLERAIGRIDLFADNETKEAATRIVQNYAEGREWVTYDELLTTVRDRFRSAMRLPPLESNVVGL